MNSDLVEDCESASLGEGKGEGKLQFSGQRLGLECVIETVLLRGFVLIKGSASWV